ncbi:MAG TPA: trypsin-like peptidase domain-containing protein, partial [Candidatus Limnocylindrales bacterium]|nr:trypsin-like peptidase domain-containing protein [Candidatus Limnocylindrales bacterium]
RGRGRALLLLTALLLGLGGGFLGGMLGTAQRDNNSIAGTSLARQRQVAQSDSQLISSIANTVGPSVVSVNVVTSGETSTDVFGFPIQSRPQEGAGTGIIISSDGLIVTNRHVVPRGVADVSITLSDGTELEDVKVVGRTPERDSLDIAFLKVEDTKGKKLVPAEIGDSSKVKVGDVVVAIGNALGQFGNSVTSGIISGYGRSVVASDGTASSAENLNDLFQTDAAINQGNSGGPLVNIDGQVVGINTAVAGEGQNIGFAIPINDVNGLIKQVLKTGRFERPYLGVRYVRLTPDTAQQYDLNVDRGAYVPSATEAANPSILENSPAAEAGLRERDVITAVNGTKIDEKNSLNTLIGQNAVGDTVELSVLRDGRTINLKAQLEALPDSQ